MSSWVELSCVAIDTLTDATQLSPTIGNATDLVEQRTANQREAGQSCFCSQCCIVMCDIPTSDVHFLRNVFSAAAFFTRSLKALVDMFFSIIPLTFLQILHSKIPSPGKLDKTRHIWRHDLQIESTGSRRSELIGDSCSRCERVDNSTSSWVELSCVAINAP